MGVSVEQQLKHNLSQVAYASLLIAVLVVLLTACASRPQEGQQIRTILPQEAIDASTTATTIAPQVNEDTRHTILALSAGGPDGAFGAGVLAGWTARGTRPEFNVVTGVSTGALLAVFAFLGSEYDQLLQTIYTTQTNESIFRQRGLAGVLGDSLYDNEPLKRQIQQYVTPEILSKIAEEHRKGRRLYIATTNLDAGELVVWDMGKIAIGEGGGRADSLQHFQKVLRASAAVPGFFQPVYIKPKRGVQLRQAHVDGGVKEPVLYASYMGRSSAPKRELFMVINGSTKRFNASVPVEPNLQSIAQKTIFELMRELQSDTIFRHFVRAEKDGVDFYMTSIPDSVPIAQKSLDFDPVRMRRLFQAGYQIGLEGTDNWLRRPPSISRELKQAALDAPQ